MVVLKMNLELLVRRFLHIGLGSCRNALMPSMLRYKAEHSALALSSKTDRAAKFGSSVQDAVEQKNAILRTAAVVAAGKGIRNALLPSATGGRQFVNHAPMDSAVIRGPINIARRNQGWRPFGNASVSAPSKSVKNGFDPGSRSGIHREHRSFALRTAKSSRAKQDSALVHHQAGLRAATVSCAGSKRVKNRMNPVRARSRRREFIDHAVVGRTTELCRPIQRTLRA